MDRRNFLANTLAFSAMGLLNSFAAQGQTRPMGGNAKRPNVVIIYGDDVGFGDIGVNGSEKIPTPNIDRLASEGINFTDAHCPAATCSPSRFSLLTGHLAKRRNIGILGPNSRMPITPDDYTLPKLFQDAGYATAVIGKWHLGLGAEGQELDWNGEVKPGPLEIGFDYSFLLPNTNDRVPCVYLENHRVVNLDPNDPISLYEKKDPRSTEYPDGRENPEAMTYYASTHGHNQSVIGGIGRIGVMYGGKSALWNDETMGDEFLRRTDAWLSKHTQANPDQPFFLYLPSQMIHVPRTPHPRFHGATELGYRGDAMVEFDATVGAVRQMLEKFHVADNTIIIFSSDNGPVYDDGYDDGTTVKTSTAEVDQGHDASAEFRGGKYQIYEGGTRVPMIVHWPGQIEPGTSDALISHTDFMASFAEFLDVPLPQGAAPDSQNVIDALLGESEEGNELIIEEAPGGKIALRHEEWKLALVDRGGGGENAEPTYALYNLANDIGEQNNVIDEFPGKAAEMKAILTQIRDGASLRKTAAAIEG